MTPVTGVVVVSAPITSSSSSFELLKTLSVTLTSSSVTLFVSGFATGMSSVTVIVKVDVSVCVPSESVYVMTSSKSPEE